MIETGWKLEHKGFRFTERLYPSDSCVALEYLIDMPPEESDAAYVLLQVSPEGAVVREAGEGFEDSLRFLLLRAADLVRHQLRYWEL